MCGLSAENAFPAAWDTGARNPDVMVSFESIVNSLKESIVLFDRTTEIVYVNKTAEELFRKSSRDMVGRRFPQLFTGDKTVSPLIRKVVREGRSFRGKSLTLQVAPPVNVDFTLSPFFQNDRAEGAVLSVSENISIADREDYDFDSLVYIIGSIAHEIKNPLGGIKGAAQLLRHRPQKAGIDEYVDLIVRETDRLNAILQDYLTICRKPAFHPVNLHEVMERALAVLQAPMQKAGVSLRRFYDPSLPQVLGDEGKLLQVFLNIIKNGIESMTGGGHLEVSTAPSRESFRDHGKISRWALITIRDTGRGISDKDLQKVFLPFYTRKKGGTGIGLALSKKVVKDHGGFITVKSQRNKGTAFSLYIPFGHHGKKDTDH